MFIGRSLSFSAHCMLPALHGGKGGGPTGERNGAYRTGRYTAEAKAEWRAARELLRQLRELIDVGDYGDAAGISHFVAKAGE
jgi:hypothetical protein